jgi:hypothetical protein
MFVLYVLTELGTGIRVAYLIAINNLEYSTNQGQELSGKILSNIKYQSILKNSEHLMEIRLLEYMVIF